MHTTSLTIMIYILRVYNNKQTEAGRTETKKKRDRHQIDKSSQPKRTCKKKTKRTTALKQAQKKNNLAAYKNE